MSYFDPALKQIAEPAAQNLAALQPNPAAEKIYEVGQSILTPAPEIVLGRMLRNQSPVAVPAKDLLLAEQLQVLNPALANYPRETRDALLNQASLLAGNGEITPRILEKLGFLTYMAERDPNLIKRCSQNLDAHFNLIEAAFKKNCDSELSAFEGLKTKINESKVQSAHSVLSVRIPRLIADQILTKKGLLNVGMISYWIHQSEIPEHNFGTTLKHRLQQLLDSKHAREELSSIQIKSSALSVDSVIRASLNLHADIPLTDRHARLTALTAALSHIRQPPSYTCFSLVICLSQLSQNIEEAVKDFKELLETNKLQRKVGQHVQDFYYIAAMTNRNLDTMFTLDSAGYVNKGSQKLWQMDGILSACLAMKIKNPRISLKKFLPQNVEKISPRMVLEFLAKNDNQNFRKGCFAFEAETTNPLLAVWSNAIAGMAEGKIAGMLKSELLRSTMHALDVNFKGLQDNQHYLIDLLDEEIIARLIQEVHFNFDPFISGYLNSSQIDREDGGFILFENWKQKELRIDNAAAFQAFISKIVIEAPFALNAKIKSKEDQDLLKKIVEHLSSYVHSNLFLDRLLPEFMRQRLPFEKPSEKINQIDQTPWLSRCGNDTAQTMGVYFGESLKKHVISAATATDLLIKIIRFGREVQETHPKMFLLRSLTTARIEELHAFNLALGHPTLSHFWKSNIDPKNWIRKNLIAPGKEVSEWIPDNNTISKICRQTRRKFFKKKNEARRKFHLETDLLLHQGKNLMELREALKTLLSITKPTSAEPGGLAALDALILRALPKEQYTKITAPAVHIADSNLWCGEEDLHFCCIYNPCVGQVQLWRCCHTNTSFTALIQKDWVKPNWEVFYCP